MKRSLEYAPQADCVRIIDQRRLPDELIVVELRKLAEFCFAISDMQVRGAPLIGITAAYGIALEMARDPSDANLAQAASHLRDARPTAVNLAWAVNRVCKCIQALEPAERPARALAEAKAIAEQDVANCRAIGDHGLKLLQSLADVAGDRPLNIMTHCNAGWLATLEWGTALAPIYRAAETGLDVHVWVSETRPRNQGASLTAWELAQANIPHTIIADNAAGYLMAEGKVDACIVGSDRTVANGDVCNKVGTYLKALAAVRHALPFYVALPVSTIDWDCRSGAEIPIEERSGAEVLSAFGRSSSGESAQVILGNAGSEAYNPAFDVTPAELVTALITEAGVVAPNEEALAGFRKKLFGS